MELRKHRSPDGCGVAGAVGLEAVCLQRLDSRRVGSWAAPPTTALGAVLRNYFCCMAECSRLALPWRPPLCLLKGQRLSTCPELLLPEE